MSKEFGVWLPPIHCEADDVQMEETEQEETGGNS